jgi:hypothetical protein
MAVSVPWWVVPIWIFCFRSSLRPQDMNFCSRAAV